MNNLSTEIESSANKIIDFYDKIESIYDYYYKLKELKLNEVSINSKDIDNMFNDYTINPNDMSFEIEEVKDIYLKNLLELVSSFPQEGQVGRKLSLIIKEKNSKKIVGLIRITSSVLSIRPRNIIFGGNLNGNQVNNFIINGGAYVPIKPFGFNYLGGKLLCYIVCSHEVRELFKLKYKVNTCFMETMALYGSLKSSSQYDGMEPIVKYGGLTQSKNLLVPDKDTYNDVLDNLRKYCKIDVKKTGSNGKNSEFMKILNIIKDHLKDNNISLYEKFNYILENKIKSLQTQKRYYYSLCGYKNSIQYINSSNSISLVKDDNYDDYYLCNLIKRWKIKAQKRYNTLKTNNKLKLGLEYYKPKYISESIW